MSTEPKSKSLKPSAKQQESPEKFSGSSSILQVIIREIADFKGWELIFQVLLYGFIAWAVYNISVIYELHTSPAYAHIPQYSIYDFKLALLMVIVFLLYKYAAQYVLYHLIKDKIKLDKYPKEEDKVNRIKQCSVWIANLIYYTGSSLAAYFLFKDQPFFPKALGGQGGATEMFKGMPYVQNIPYGIEFYMVQFACHLYTLIDYCVYKRKAVQFWEMFLHHSMAVFLIFFSYMTGGIRVGIMVLYVHDPCDVLVYGNRIFSELKNPWKPAQYFSYICLIVGWVYFRLFAFPKAIVGAAFDYVLSGDLGILYSPHLFMTLMLASLVILHIYWFICILKVLVNMVTGKKHYNDYDVSNKQAKKSD